VIKDIITRMAVRPLKSLLPTADDVANSDLPTLGGILLVHLKSYEGLNTVYQHVGGINREYFFAIMERRNVGLGPLPGNEPEYGARQPEVTQAMREAWNWLEREGHLMRTPGQPSPDWFSLTRSGEELLKRHARYEKWEKLGVDRVKADLTATGGIRDVGGTPEVKQMAWDWVRMKENKPPVKPAVAGEWTLIAESRLVELRALVSAEFDFRKLIRLCEELNINSREDCHFGTAMLTRGLLDHVPPVFGKTSFSEVANNYGARSFKETMQPLDGVARKVADWHLHGQIRKSETLPTAQQVRFAASLDMLLSEIVRITQEKGPTP
jgi:hypothetical protein